MTPRRHRLAVSLFSLLCLAAIAPVLGETTVAPAATRPAAAAEERVYRLLLRWVADGDVLRHVFVIVTPECDVVLTDPTRLHERIEQLVGPAPAVLRWEPSDVRAGAEPLDDPAALRSLRAFCEARQIRFVVFPGG